MFHRNSFSAGDRHPVRHPSSTDDPALDPLGRPHQRNLQQAEKSSCIRALDLLPRRSAREAKARFAPPASSCPSPSTVAGPPASRGREHPVFTGQCHQDFIVGADRCFDEVRQGPNPGANAAYIEELARCDDSCLSMSIVSPNGAVHHRGDGTVFSIQSISKIFILACAVRRHGLQRISGHWATLSSRQRFDGPATAGLLGHPLEPEALACTTPQSTTRLLALMRAAGDTRFANASCNLGAIGLTMLLPSADDAIARQEALMRFIAETGAPSADRRNTVATAHEVYGSEIRDTAGNQLRARVAATLLADETPIDGDLPLHAFGQLQAYVAACALAMNTGRLAAGFSAFATGRNIFTGQRVLTEPQARFVREQMRVSGLYQDSLRFHEETGWIAKSGVGGGIVALCPETGIVVAVHSTRLDMSGNSARGLDLLRKIARSPEYLRLRETCRQARSGPAAESAP